MRTKPRQRSLLLTGGESAPFCLNEYLSAAFFVIAPRAVRELRFHSSAQIPSVTRLGVDAKSMIHERQGVSEVSPRNLGSRFRHELFELEGSLARHLALVADTTNFLFDRLRLAHVGNDGTCVFDQIFRPRQISSCEATASPLEEHLRGALINGAPDALSKDDNCRVVLIECCGFNARGHRVFKVTGEKGSISSTECIFDQGETASFDGVGIQNRSSCWREWRRRTARAHWLQMAPRISFALDAYRCGPCGLPILSLEALAHVSNSCSELPRPRIAPSHVLLERSKHNRFELA
jgi:hypothetical protein